MHHRDNIFMGTFGTQQFSPLPQHSFTFAEVTMEERHQKFNIARSEVRGRWLYAKYNAWLSGARKYKEMNSSMKTLEETHPCKILVQ